MHPQESEDLLIQRAVKRDRVAFAILYDKYIDQVYQYVYYRVSNQVDAEDSPKRPSSKPGKPLTNIKGLVPPLWPG